MTELRVTVPDEIAERLVKEGAERGTSAEDVAADVLRLHVPAVPEGKRLGFIGMFDASPGFDVQRAEEQLEAEGFVESS